MSEEGENANGKRPLTEGDTAEAAAEDPKPPKVAKTEGGEAEATAAPTEPPAATATTDADAKPNESKAEEEAKEGEAPNPGSLAETPAPVNPPNDAAATTQAASAAPAPPPDPIPQLPSGLPPALGGPAAPTPAIAANDDEIIEERGQVSSLYVGRVIGKGGEMIRDLQARSGCRIDVDQSVPPGQPRIITYRGTRKTVDFAQKLVNMLCHENVNEADLPLGEAKREIMAVPAQSVGKIIGRGGEMIRELQSRSHAKIQVDHNNQGSAGLPPDQKRLTITGSDQSVVKAKEMVLFLVANPMVDAMQSLNMLMEDKLHRGGVWGSGPPYPNMPNQGQSMMQNMVGGGAAPGGYGAPPAAGGYGGAAATYGGGYGAPAAGYGMPAATAPYGQAAAPMQQPYGQTAAYGAAAGGSEMEMFYAAKTYMGRIIGQKGVTINDLQRRSGCDIQINQDVAPGQDCEISLRGARQGIDMAKQMLQEIIEIGPAHPYAGGAPQYGGGGGGYQQQSSYGQQQPSYGQQPPQQQAYYGGGGYPQQQAYGQPYDQQQQQQPVYGQQPQAMYGGQPAAQMYGGGMAQPQAAYQAAPAYGGAPAVSSWKTAQAADGQVYYYNEKTGETQWDKPVGMP